MSNPMPQMPNVDMSALLAQLTPQIMQMNESGWRPPCHGGYGFGACDCTASSASRCPNPGSGSGSGSSLNPNPKRKPRRRGRQDGDTARPTIKFKFGPRPKGTPGRGNFKLRKVFGINRFSYKLLLRGTKRLCIMTHLDMTKSIRNQDQRRVRKVRDRGLILFPELQGFSDPEWPMQALIYVVLKSSTETERRIRNNLTKEKAKAKEKARAKAKGKGKAVTPPSASPADASVNSISMDLSKFTISDENPDMSTSNDFDDANDISMNLGITDLPPVVLHAVPGSAPRCVATPPPVPVLDHAPAVAPSHTLSSAPSRAPSQAPIPTLTRDLAPAVASTPASTSSAISTPDQAGS
ncbi:hypothetical protein FS749_007521 [Ceratobasidium sp. UAMH 11750]|nr:hypothetical protein FS749_007521 [Ceratobasidium sp. UAMH 11750]